MAYNINKSNSDPITIPSGAIDNQFDVPLIGQDAINYGDDLALAFVRLLENFAADNEPAFGANRMTGQLWYDTTGTGQLNIFDGTNFVAIPKASEVVDNTTDENISGIKTFNGIPNFNGGSDLTDPPFNVDSNFLVTKLNADLLDGEEGSYYAPASSVVGKETTWVPAAKMYPSVTNGATGEEITDSPGGDTANTLTPNLIELTAGNPCLHVWEFPTGVVRSAEFCIAMPKRWNLGTVTFEAYWTTQSADTGSVIFNLQGVAMGTTETIDTPFTGGTPAAGQSSTAAAQGIENLVKGAESSAYTIGGTPGDDNMCFFRLSRDGATDTHTGTALLTGIKLYWTSDAATDD